MNKENKTMEKNLLETMRENNKSFDTGIDAIIAYAVDHSKDLAMQKAYAKSQFRKFRIEELETFLRVFWKKNKPWGGDSGKESDRQIYGYNEAIFDIVNLVKETIKRLKEDDEKI